MESHCARNCREVTDKQTLIMLITVSCWNRNDTWITVAESRMQCSAHRYGYMGAHSDLASTFCLSFQLFLLIMRNVRASTSRAILFKRHYLPEWGLLHVCYTCEIRMRMLTNHFHLYWVSTFSFNIWNFGWILFTMNISLIPYSFRSCKGSFRKGMALFC